MVTRRTDKGENDMGALVQKATLVTSPALRYHGAKWRLGPWIIKHFPPHRVYVEPFGGSAAVLLQKPASYAEIYNEIDGEIVNFFKVLRDCPDDLRSACQNTPFSRTEFYNARYEQGPFNRVEAARRTVVRSYMGFGSNSITQSSGFRRDSNRSGSTPARDWARWPERIERLAERLRGVVIENSDALSVIKHFDRNDALIYVDPPYLAETRTAHGGYRYDMGEQGQHKELIETLKNCESSVVLSGYPSNFYSDILSDWHCVTREALADGAKKRIECIWLNQRAVCGQSQVNLFDWDAA